MSTSSTGSDASGPATAERDWNTASLRELIAHICATHHELMRRILPELSAKLAAAVIEQGKDEAPLQFLKTMLERFLAELEQHLGREEVLLFPVVQTLEAAVAYRNPLFTPPFGSVGQAVRLMDQEHHAAREGLDVIRDITGGYVPPPHACDAYRALLAGLADLDKDLRRHMYLETDILLPRAALLEASQAEER